MNIDRWQKGDGFLEWTDDLSAGGVARAWMRIVNFQDGSGSSNARYSDPRKDPSSVYRHPFTGSLGPTKLPTTDETALPYIGHKNMSPAGWALWGLSTTSHAGLRATAVDAQTWFDAVMDGRDVRYNRLHGRFYIVPFFGLPEETALSKFDLLGDLAYIAKRDACRYFVLGATKSGGALNLEAAAYAMFRACVDKNQWQSTSTSVTHKPRVPRLHVLELGTIESGVPVPKKQLLYNAGVFRGNGMDFGLARSSESLDAPDTVVCTSAYGFGEVVSLQFPFQSASEDATIFCIVDPPAGGEAAGVFMAMSAATNNPVGPLLRPLDFGELIPCAHFAGAAATTPFAEIDVMFDTVAGRRFMERYPRSPEWPEWGHSKYPYTMHAGFRLGVAGPEQTPWDKLSKTPVYGVRPGSEPYADVVIDTSELIPLREVAARSATLIGSAIANDRSGRNAAAPYIMSCAEDNPFIISGKKVTKVTLKFEPYLNESQDFETEIDEVAVPNPGLFPTGLFGDPDGGKHGEPQDGWVGGVFLMPDLYFDHTETIPVPAGKTPFGSGPLHRGTYLATRLVGAFAGGDGKRTTTVGAGVIPAATTQNIVALRVSPIHAINRIGGDTVPQSVAGLFRQTGPRVFAIPEAPIAGEYDLTTFSCGGIAAAGNAFRYAGSGQWDQQCEFNYKKYLWRMTVNDSWVPAPPPFFANTVLRSKNRNYEGGPVVITERWRSTAPYAEVHARLGVALQEHGTYDKDDESLVVSPDAPLARLVEMATYSEGYEPAAALHIEILARVVPSATLTLATDNSELPAGYPWELTNAEAPGVSDPKPSGMFKELSHQFNADETERLLNGEAVPLVDWQNDPSQHVLIEFGVPHRVICTLETELV